MNALAESPQMPALSSAHKAAVILAALSPETASAIVQEISDAQLRVFAIAFGDLKSVPAPLLQAVAKEFVAEVERSSSELAGGVAAAKRMLESLAEADRVNRILSELHGGGSQSVWKRLCAVPLDRILPYLKAQRLPVAAAIVTKLPFENAASILSAADGDFAHALLSALSQGGAPSEQIEEAIAAAVEEELLRPLANSPTDDGVNEVVGEILNFLPSAKRDAFLDHLDAEAPKIGAAVRKSIVTFQDLHLRVSEAGVAALMRLVEKDTLLAALKHGRTNAAETASFLLSNVSKRMAEQYQAEMNEMADLSDEDGEAAQRNVMKTVRELANKGELKIAPLPQ
jgi:flagellar motor switch protein FliG